jgi:hypothetical protein
LAISSGEAMAGALDDMLHYKIGPQIRSRASG